MGDFEDYKTIRVMIDTLRIQNLRSIKDSADIALKPIMILLGANSSGKSTFLRSFPLFAQSVDKKLRGPIAWFDTSFVDFGDYKTAKNKYAPEQEGITFSYKMSNVRVALRRNYYPNIEMLDEKELKDVHVSFTLKDDSKGTYIDDVKIKIPFIEYELSIKGRNENVECMINGNTIEMPERFTFNFNTSFAILPSFISNRQNEDGDSAVYLIANKLVSIFKNHCSGRLHNTQRLEQILCCPYLDRAEFLKHLKKGSGIKSFQKSIQNWTVSTAEFNTIYNYFALLKLNVIIGSINIGLADFYHSCDYIAPMRAEADRFYRIQGLQVQAVDPSGHNLLEFIASLKPKEKEDYDKFVFDVLGVTVDVPSESGMKSIRIKTANGDFSIADVGYGYSQVLPVITKLWHTTFAAVNNVGYYSRLRFKEFDKKTILMEQPELHLHPAMQAKIADTLVKTVNNTREAGDCATLIIETHSQALINRLGRRIREGKILPDDINVLLFQKDADMKNTSIKQISFSENGQLKDWPYGFFDPLDD